MAKAPVTVTIKPILEKAIQREIEAQRLYTELSKKVKDTAAKEALQQLVIEEKGHQDKLERYQHGELKGGLSGGQVINYKIAEKLDYAPIAPEMGLKDVFLLVANREKASNEFYLGLAEIHHRGQVRTLLEELAAQELQHKQKMESLYTEVAFPQTDGG